MKSKKDPFKLDMVSIRLVKDKPLMSNEYIRGPEDAVRLLGAMMCQMDREVMFVINLNTKNAPINGTMVSMGAIDQTVVAPREIFKASILSNATRIMLLHNHPSGDLTPSREDIVVTSQLVKAGAIMGIPVMDHIIVGGDNSQFFSLCERGMLSNPDLKLTGNLNNLDFDQKPENVLKVHEHEPGNIYMRHIKNQSKSVSTNKGLDIGI